jgi:nicotinate dehydrogenase subunit B
MTAPSATTTDGLRIVGPVPMPFAQQRTGYAATAYGGSEPSSDEPTWLVLGADGRATAFAGKVEYGQGIRTGLAIEVADELRLPLDAVDIVLGDTNLVPWDMGTFGSQSTRNVGLQLRKAAATARAALLDLAADALDLPSAELEARDGRVVSLADPKQSISYRELLAGRTVQRRVADDVALLEPAKFSVMGADHRRIDAVSRVTGAAVYSQDVQVAGVLFAAVARPPSYGAHLIDADIRAAEHLPGVVGVFREGSILAVLADSDEAAELGLRVTRTQWEERPSNVGRFDIPQHLLQTAEDPVTIQERGSLDDGFASAAHILEGTYYVPYVSNMPMEPRAAVAEWSGDSLRVWAGSQRPFGIRTDLAQHFGIPEDRVHVISTEIGGGFGGKSIYRPAIEAAVLAKLSGRPVRVAWSRAEEITWATFRPAAVIEIRSGFKGDGQLVAWSFKAVHAAKSRPMIGQRGSDTPYDVPNVHVTVAAGDGPLPAGSFRSLGGAVNHFAREVHMDEIAAALGLDPVEFRLRNLSHRRLRRVLERTADSFGWTGTTGGAGIAIGSDVGSYAATAVQLDVQGSEVKVSRVTVGMDCGLTVNPDGARNQAEGSIVMGLGTALYEEAEVEAGRLLNPGYTRYRVPRINNVPAINVVLLGEPDVPSTGAGEPGMVPLAAAVSNAVYARTGKRIRELPIQRHLR